MKPKNSDVAAWYSLPNVDVYPQNRFGDIARRKGLSTARNWSALRAAVANSKDQFLNDSRTQFVLSLLPVAAAPKSVLNGRKLLLNEKLYKQYLKESAKLSPQLEAELTNKTKKAHEIRLKYNKEVRDALNTATNPDAKTADLIDAVDRDYGTNYKKAFEELAKEDPGKYISYGALGDAPDYRDVYGMMVAYNPKGNIPSTALKDHKIVLNDNVYAAGTANHELGHLADDLAGSNRYINYDSGSTYTTNPYLHFLADADNAYSMPELRTMNSNLSSKGRDYLLNPSEAKSQMLSLKRGLVDEGKLRNWGDVVDEATVSNYVNTPGNLSTLKAQYDLYKDKSRYIDRLNKLTPMGLFLPLSNPTETKEETNLINDNYGEQ